MGGWGIIVADIIVMANLAEIASLYTFQLFGIDGRRRGWVVLALGVAWIAVMTSITWIGIELSARTQVFLLGAEIAALVLFAVVALVKVYGGDAPEASSIPRSLAQPVRHPDTSALVAALVLLAIFIYWGWDSTVTVNEETEDSTEAPGERPSGRRSSWSRIYVIVSVAAVPTPARSSSPVEENQDDVLGALGDRRPRLAAGQDPDHRGPDVCGRLDSDDDPADGAHHAVDGAPRVRSPSTGHGSTRAT